MRQQTSNELRCFCRRSPLLATYGVDDKGGPYVHVKVYKAKRIFGEIICTEGVIHLHCRECMRWHKINIKKNVQPVLQESDPPNGVMDHQALTHD